MAKTPEGEVKDICKAYLLSIGLCPSKDAVLATSKHTGWFHMPVPAFQGVMGQNDFHGHYKGRFFGIETKIPGKDPTPLQAHQIKAINVTGAVSFVVRCKADLAQIEEWRLGVDREIKEVERWISG